jgi:hypothetical protein
MAEAGSCALAIPGGGPNRPDLGYGGYVSCTIDSLTKVERVRISAYAREAGNFTVNGEVYWYTAEEDGPRRNSSSSTQVTIT